MSEAGFHAHLPSGVADSGLFRQAMTHRSGGREHNERLEFLGDAVLGMVVADDLYRRHPGANEGTLSRMRSYLVRKETLAEIGQALGLGDAVVLGSGELKSGGFRRDTILANTLEAVIGAIYLLRGLAVTERFISAIYGPRMDVSPSLDLLKDPKTRLQELLQGRGIERPRYELLDTRGAAHRQEFQARCRVPALKLSRDAWGSSKRKAEQACAVMMLEAVESLNSVPAGTES